MKKKINKNSKIIIKFILVFFLYYFYSIIQSLIKNEYLMIINNIITTISLLIIFKSEIMFEWEIFKKDYKKTLLIALKFWLIGILVMYVTTYLASFFKASGIPDNQAANEYLLKMFPLASILSVVIFAPFIEEMVFRFNYRHIVKKDWLYLLISTILFGGIHMLSGIYSFADVLYLIAYSFFGFVFALIHVKTKSIFPVIIFHSIHNIIVLIFTI